MYVNVGEQLQDIFVHPLKSIDLRNVFVFSFQPSALIPFYYMIQLTGQAVRRRPTRGRSPWSFQDCWTSSVVTSLMQGNPDLRASGCHGCTVLPPRLWYMKKLEDPNCRERTIFLVPEILI